LRRSSADRHRFARGAGVLLSPALREEAGAMTAPTVYLSRLMGIVALIFAVAMLLEKPTIIAAAQLVLQDRALMLVLGIVTTVVGAAIVLLHNLWTRGLWPLVVTLTGWMFLMRGVVFLLLPPEFLAPIVARFHFADFFYVYAMIPLVLGTYLSLRGFTAR
jgi:hypothetical protein